MYCNVKRLRVVVMACNDGRCQLGVTGLGWRPRADRPVETLERPGQPKKQNQKKERGLVRSWEGGDRWVSVCARLLRSRKGSRGETLSLTARLPLLA